MYNTTFYIVKVISGDGEIRTLGPVSQTQSFQDCALDRYATSPMHAYYSRKLPFWGVFCIDV